MLPESHEPNALPGTAHSMDWMNGKTKQETSPESVFWVLSIPHSSKQISTHLKVPSPERSGMSRCSQFALNSKKHTTELIHGGIVINISPRSDQGYPVWLSSSLFTHPFLYPRVNINTYVNSRCLKREGSHSSGTAFACSFAITKDCSLFCFELPVQRSWSWT